MKKIIVIILSSLVLSECSSLTSTIERPDATQYVRQASYAFREADVLDTKIGNALAGLIKQNSGESGFYILASGHQSLKARMALIQSAEKTIDLQYYAMNDDITSNLMVEAIIRAAERGVRVRLLLDDISSGKIKKNLSALNNTRNIEVRIFNPMTTTDQSLLSRVTGILTDLPQVNKRMHNKVLIADNLVAVTGGRNLGDEYFEYSRDMIFKDIDVLATNPVAQTLSHSFDDYWNDENSFPLAAVYDVDKDEQALTDLRKQLRHNWDLQTKEDDSLIIAHDAYWRDLQKKLIWAPAEVTADDPVKVQVPTDSTDSPPARRIARLADSAEQEFIIVSSYFVPQDEGVEWIADILKRGVSVKILTNSLASTDVVAAHTGYQRYRKDLLQNGAELYEMKPALKKIEQRVIGTGTPSQASLHSKFYIVDRKKIFIGSFNLDPRSVRLNTEVGLVIHSPEIAEQMSGMFERITGSEYSYKLMLDDDESLMWVSEKDGKPVKYGSDPDASIWRDIQASLMSLLPIEDHL